MCIVLACCADVRKHAGVHSTSVHAYTAAYRGAFVCVSVYMGTVWE